MVEGTSYGREFMYELRVCKVNYVMLDKVCLKGISS